MDIQHHSAAMEARKAPDHSPELMRENCCFSYLSGETCSMVT